MGDGHASLAKTVDEVSRLLAQTGLDRDGVINVKQLARDTALLESEVRDLLDGKELPTGEAPDDVEREVARRIQFLTRTRLFEYEGPNGEKLEREYTAREIAAGSGMTPQWHNILRKKEKAPNVPHIKGMADFFGVAVDFFTDTPAQALDRALKARVIPHLQSFLADPGAAIKNKFAMDIQMRLGTKTIDPDDYLALMRMVDGIARSSTGG